MGILGVNLSNINLDNNFNEDYPDNRYIYVDQMNLNRIFCFSKFY